MRTCTGVAGRRVCVGDSICCSSCPNASHTGCKPHSILQKVWRNTHPKHFITSTDVTSHGRQTSSQRMPLSRASAALLAVPTIATQARLSVPGGRKIDSKSLCLRDSSARVGFDRIWHYLKRRHDTSSSRRLWHTGTTARHDQSACEPSPPALVVGVAASGL